MKKLLLTLLAILPALAFAQNAFTIKGTAGTTNAPAKVFLIYRLNNKQVTDSTVLKNGKFTFNGNITEVTIARLMLDYKGTGYRSLFGKTRPDMATIYLAPGTTIVKSPDSLVRAKATGTKVSQENTQLQALIKPETDKMKALQAKFQQASPELKKTKEFTEGLQKTAEEIKGREKIISISFIKKHPNSYISLILVNSLMGDHKAGYQDIASYYALLSANIKNNSLGKTIATHLDQLKAASLGGTAPEFAMADTSGKMINTASFKGKYLFINFWGPWNALSRTQNAQLLPLVNTYKNKGFAALSVCINQPGKGKDWTEAIRKDGLTWPQVSDLKRMQNTAAALYNVHKVPSNFLIDPSGKIIAKDLRDDELATKLSQVLGKM